MSSADVEIGIAVCGLTGRRGHVGLPTTPKGRNWFTSDRRRCQSSFPTAGNPYLSREFVGVAPCGL